MTVKKRPESLAPQCRTVALRLMQPGTDPDGDDDLAEIGAEDRTLSFSFASAAPVETWYGTEVLSMAPGAMRSGVRQKNMPLLFNHDADDLLGAVQDVQITGGKARATVRFGRDARGQWAMEQAKDGVLTNVSFLYRVFKFVEDTEAETLTAIDWEPYEISLVTVPADPTVGVGRSLGHRRFDTDPENGVQITRSAAATQSNPAPGDSRAPGAHISTTPPEENDMIKFRGSPRLQEGLEATTSTGGGAVATPPTVPAVPAGPDAGQLRATEQRGAEGERARIAEIEALAKRYKLPEELRAGLIQRGASVDAARMAAADVVMERAAKTSATVDLGEGANPDLSAKDKARYSMIRAVNAALSGDWKKAGFELECNNEISKNLGRGPQNERGFFIPTNIAWASRAAYAVGTPGAGTTGGTMVATQLLAGSFIEVLRNKARVMSLGATVLSGLVGNVTIPRQTGQSTTYWTTENVNTTESEATFDMITLTLKTIGTYSQISRNMLMQSTPDIDMIVRADLIAAVALGIDAAALYGIGSGGVPLGIANTAGIGSVIGGVNGAAITIDNLIDLETQVAAANAPEEGLAYLANAKTVGSLKKLKSTTGQYLWTNSPGGQRSGTPGEINGYPVARSNQARSTLVKGASGAVCSEVFFGSWPELLIGEWGVLEIVPNPYDAAVFKNGGVLLRVLQSLDIAVRHAASFAVMSDALTP